MDVYVYLTCDEKDNKFWIGEIMPGAFRPSEHNEPRVPVIILPLTKQAKGILPEIIYTSEELKYILKYPESILRISEIAELCTRDLKYVMSNFDNDPNKLREYTSCVLSAPFCPDDMKETINGYISDMEQKIANKKAKIEYSQIRRYDFAKKRPELMLALIERDGYICQGSNCWCREDLTIDHINPLSKGGNDELDNLQLLCQSCNSKKGASL